MKVNRTAYRLKRLHTILVKNPSPRSMAAFVRYKMWLANLENITAYDKWMKFRYDFLAKKQKEGPLTCAYCGKGDLQIYTSDDNKLATCDHIVPTSRGGARFDENNLCVACSSCNGKKANMPVEEFKRCLPKQRVATA